MEYLMDEPHTGTLSDSLWMLPRIREAVCSVVKVMFGACERRLCGFWKHVVCVHEHVSHSSGGSDCVLFFSALLELVFSQRRSDRRTEKRCRIKDTERRSGLCACDWETASLGLREAERGARIGRWRWRGEKLQQMVTQHQPVCTPPGNFLFCLVSTCRCSSAPPSDVTVCLDTILSLWAIIQCEVLPVVYQFSYI